MNFSLRLILGGAISLISLAASPQDRTAALAVQNVLTKSTFDLSDQLPNAPSPQQTTLAFAQSPETQSASNSHHGPGPEGAKESSSTAPPDPVVRAEQTRQQKAQQQIKEEEQQRLLGIVPMFNTTYRTDAVSLTAKQKMDLAFRSTIDPVTFGTAFVVAGWGEALDQDNGFGWGAEGFAKRAGAKYLDAFNGTMIGNGILPAVLRQDPRYFRLGQGSKTHRALYALSTAFICKHDSTGKWEPNYSNVGGNLAAGAISNLYYPGSTSWNTTIVNGMIVTAEGTMGALFQEFWPDISRKALHRDPTNGLDAQVAAADAAKQENEPQERQTASSPARGAR